MRPLGTLLVGIIAFTLGIVVALKAPALAASWQTPAQQAWPVTAKAGPDGVTFQNITKNPVLIVGLSNEQSRGFTIDGGQKMVSDGTSVFLIYEYEASHKYIYYPKPMGGRDEIGPCYPADCVLPPIPCPGPCPPWWPIHAFQLNPAIK